MAYFKIEGGRVVQRQPYSEEGFIEGPDDVCCGYTYRNGKFSRPATPEPALDWLPLIAARRYEAEVSGITLGGIPVATDDRSKLLINGAALRAIRETGYTLRWKTGEGFIDLSAEQVLAMADAVADHVQACFDREAELQAAVADGSITAEMLEQGWPA